MNDKQRLVKWIAMLLIAVLACFTVEYASAESPSAPYNKEVYYSGKINARDWDGIWSAPYTTSGASWFGFGEKYNGQQAEIIREARTSAGTYYQFRISGRLIGWMDKQAFQSVNSETFYNKSVNYIGKIQSRKWDSIWSKPYAYSGTSWQSAGSSLNNVKIKIVREAKTVHGIYYQFQVNGQTKGWIDKQAVQILGDGTYYSKTIYLAGQIEPKNGDGVWSAPYHTPEAKWLGFGSMYKGKQADIIGEAKTPHGTYYRFRIDGQTKGWMDKRAFQSVKNAMIYNKSVYYIGKAEPRSWDGLWSAPYAAPEANWIGFGQDFNDKTVEIIREAKTAHGVYYQFRINGKTKGWMDQKAFQILGDGTYYDKEIYYVGTIQSRNWDSIWNRPYQTPNASWTGSASNFNGKQAEIIREAKTNHGVYYQFRIDGKLIGWLDKSAFQSINNSGFYNKKVYRVGKLQPREWDGIWSKPYAYSGTSWQGPGTNFSGQRVEVTREAKTIHGTYYQFEINNRTIGWMDKAAFNFLQSRNDNFIDYQGYVFNADSLNMRQGPGTNYSRIKYLHRNDSVTVIGEQGDWLKVKHDGDTGFVSDDYVLKGTPPAKEGNQYEPPLSQNSKKGIDVSHWQGTIDFSKVKNSGFQFVIAKATQGQSSEDPYFVTNINNARKNGLNTNAYHFFEANSVADAIKEADHFIEKLKEVDINGYVFLDVEDQNGHRLSSDKTKLTSYVNAFLNRLYSNGYSKIGIYVNQNFYYNRLNAGDLPNNALIWIARYRGSESYLGPEIPADIWQYTSTGAASGVNGHVDIDITYMNGF